MVVVVVVVMITCWRIRGLLVIPPDRETNKRYKCLFWRMDLTLLFFPAYEMGSTITTTTITFTCPLSLRFLSLHHDRNFLHLLENSLSNYYSLFLNWSSFMQISFNNTVHHHHLNSQPISFYLLPSSTIKDLSLRLASVIVWILHCCVHAWLSTTITEHTV